MTDAVLIPRTSLVYTWEPSNRAIAARYGLRPDQILRFDTNTSPAAPDFVAEVLAGPFDPPLNEYPDSGYEELTSAAAGYVGVPESEIVVGCGADEILDMIAKSHLGPGDGSLVPVPTYAMYGVLTGQRGARIVSVPRLGADADFALDMPATIDRLRDVAVVWLAAPNNPTGAAEPASRIRRLLEESAGLGTAAPAVVVDEAYTEFGGETCVPLRDEFPNLIVVRTVSKAFALPGIRVGYAVAARRTIERLERVRPPGSVSTISATLAAAALRNPESGACQRRPHRDGARVAGRAAGRGRLGAVSEHHELPPRAHRHAGRGGGGGRTPAARRHRPPDIRSGEPVARPSPPDGPKPRGERAPAEGGCRMSDQGEVGQQTVPGASAVRSAAPRRATRERSTRETQVRVSLDIDGTGQASVKTGVGFYDHLLTSLAHHALFDLTIDATGDLEVDEHHTVEDVALVLGEALAEALGDRRGITRFGDASVPMDEAFATAVVDVSGRPFAVLDLPFRGERIGELPTQLVEHALESFARTAGLTLHLRASGRNDHHVAEAAFKALARALRAALTLDPRRGAAIPSTKGTLA